MINRLLSITIAVSLITVFSGFSQIPNSSFEDWADGNPVGWSTSNYPGFFTPITQSTDAHSGSYAVKGEVVNFVGVGLSPTLVSGDTLGGFPIDQTPAALQGYYKFSPAGGDILFISALIYEQGNTVGFGEIMINAPATSYSLFTLNFEYYGQTIVADSCWIQVFLVDTATGDATIGSYYLLDDLSFSGTVDITDNPHPVSARKFDLEQNYPNPFNPSTTISFSVPQVSVISLVVYNIMGQEISRPIDTEHVSAGNHSVNWSAGDLPSGTYFYRLITESGVISKKMILMK